MARPSRRAVACSTTLMTALGLSVLTPANPTAASPGEDFTTWDLPRLFAEIDKQFTKALAAEKELKATPIATYDALLEKGTMPDTYRPTLYDFIAFDALNFYSSPEQAGAKPE